MAAWSTKIASQLMREIDAATAPKIMRWQDALATYEELRESLDVRIEAMRAEHPDA